MIPNLWRRRRLVLNKFQVFLANIFNTAFE